MTVTKTSMWMIRESSRSSNCAWKYQKQYQHTLTLLPLHSWRNRGKQGGTHLRTHPEQEKDQSISAQTCKCNNNHPLRYWIKHLIAASTIFYSCSEKSKTRLICLLNMTYLPMLLLTMAPTPSCWGLAKNFLTTTRPSLKPSETSVSDIFLFIWLTTVL